MKKNQLQQRAKSFLTSVRGILNFHDPKNISLYIIIGFVVLFILALVVRKNLAGATNVDYWIFVSWYDYVKAHGIGSFNTDFSNYNPPYTYFLYLVTLLPVAKIVAIKGLMIVFDILLAFAVYLVVRQLKPGKYLPMAAGIGSLFIPTVLATGIFWGQFDQLYTAFLLFSLYYLLKDNSKLTWLFFGIAIAIKLQAIFFLPVLIIMSFKRIKMWHAVYGLGAFAVLTFLPVLAGRSVSSILNIYVAQTNLFSGALTLNAPNLYQWVPNSAFEYLNSAGIYMTMAFIVGIFIISLLYKKYSNRDILLLSSIMLFVVPFLLPQMHERYFFTATVFTFILAVAIPKLRFIIIAIVMQITTLLSYIPTLFSYTFAMPISFSILALASLAMSLVLIYEFVSPSEKPSLIQRLKQR